MAYVWPKAAMPLTKINTDQLQRVDLNKYNINTSKWKLFWFSPKVITKIEQWIQSGGTLIAYQDAIKWLNDNKLIELVLKLASWGKGHFIRAIGRLRAHKKSQVQYLKLN
jgi:hypothetical protein